MGQSSNELCGHDREALRNMLAQWAETPDVVHAMAIRAWDDPSLRGPNYDEQEWQIARDLNDPARLAEMLAARGRELGVEAHGWSIASHTQMDRRGHYQIWVTWSGTIQCDAFDEKNIRCRSGLIWTTPQARAILRTWLELEDGEAEKALEALRGNA